VRPLVAALLVAAVAVAAVAVVLSVRHRDQAPPPAASSTAGPSAPAVAGAPTADDLLGADEVQVLDGSRRWQVVSTGPNTAGTGLHSVCQQSRFADPRGLAAVVRTFRADGSPGRRAVQVVEVSRSPAEARRGFATTVGWFAGCRVARVQLVDAYRVRGLGDQAVLLTLRLGRLSRTTVSVAVARTGSVTTTTVGTTVGGAAPGPELVTRSLADAVNRICAARATTGCVRQAAYRRVPPPPSGTARGFLAVVDLPSVGAVRRPWVGTRPAPVTTGRASPTCDRAVFRGPAVRAGTATYLVPRAALPTRFGLTETYGVFRTPRAAAGFLAGVRRSVAGCEDRDPATQVGPERRRSRATAPPLDASAWDLATRVSEQETVRFRVGFVRVGRSVAQLSFTPAPGADLAPAAFDALLVRAADRLRELG
jgi:hypothetical protein